MSITWEDVQSIPHDYSFVSESIVFNENKHYFVSATIASGSQIIISEPWLDVVYSASAAYVCEDGGDILELGFNSSNFIQSHSISSHTICEVHPDKIAKAQEWAVGKSNVTIITGSWYQNKDDLSTYDGILHNREFTTDQFWLSSSVESFTKSGTRFTFDNQGASGSYNCWGIPTDSYQEVSVTPSGIQTYFTSSIYYMPKKEF